MKRMLFVFLLFTFCLKAQYSLCQVKNDFSDWNVPPPVPPGTIPKGPGGGQPPILLQLSDVPAPDLQLINFKLVSLSPILQTAPDVPAPEQPQFPSLPFDVPDIPLPQVPRAMDLPKQTFHDEVIPDGNTDMPEPAAPEIPELPKMPVTTQKPSDNIDLKLPVIPAIVAQPVSVALPADAFPFIDWPVPGIPVNSELNSCSTNNATDDKVKPNIKKKTAKKFKGG